ncbi:MAG: hypothetical protein E6L05_03395 [Thaumarchaeota archaeon]|nr:MAG: hypothetical protein E6L05_03395 [Nitrososphaerota archaeon]
MRDDDYFEIDRAFDLLPHVVGASWAAVWFRMNKKRQPTPEEFRNKVVEYFEMLDLLVDSYPKSGKFLEMAAHVKQRNKARSLF